MDAQEDKQSVVGAGGVSTYGGDDGMDDTRSASGKEVSLRWKLCKLFYELTHARTRTHTRTHTHTHTHTHAHTHTHTRTHTHTHAHTHTHTHTHAQKHTRVSWVLVTG